MDLTAPKIAAQEHIDPPAILDRAATALAHQILHSKHFIAFTGAGVSTSAGIPDFRGPEGAWTLRAQGRQMDFKAATTLQAVPTPTHMALVELQDRGWLRYLVSQNCDGLHRRSGMLPVSWTLVFWEEYGSDFGDVCRIGSLNCMGTVIASTARIAGKSSFAVCILCPHFTKKAGCSLILTRFPSCLDLRKVDQRPSHRSKVHTLRRRFARHHH
jgi:NAD-dependent SIR2 family protein deacetylase